MSARFKRKAQSAKRKTFNFLLVVLTFAFLLLTFVLPVEAQSNPYLQPNTNPDVPRNLHTWTQTVMLDVMAALSCQLTGIDPTNLDPQTGGPSRKCLGYDGATGKIGFAEGGNGAIGVMGHFIAATFTPPPVSTGEYLAYMGNKFGIVEPAYAQGVGFKGITPIAKIWETFRNITYLIFVVVFVVIGFMIMLRVKIDPRTVMTVQNSIPRVIVGIVLVTFSFAISGFLIDLMYLSTSIVTNLLVDIAPDTETRRGLSNVTQATNPFDAANIVGDAGIDKSFTPAIGPISAPFSIPDDILPSGGFLTFATGPAGSIAEVVGPLAETFPGRLIMGGITGAIAKIFGVNALEGFINVINIGPLKVINKIFDVTKQIPLVGENLENTLSNIFMGIAFGAGFIGAGGLAKALAFVIVFLILAIIIIWTLARLWIQLLTAYIWVLIDVVFAPFWILGGMFPGSPVSFSSWLRDIIAYLSVFPSTIAMLLLAKLFMGMFPKKTDVFIPPLVGPQDASIIAPFIGFGMLLLTPVVVTIVKDALKAPKFPYGAAIGQALAVGPGTLGSVTYAVASPYGMLSQVRFLRGMLGREGGWRNLLRGTQEVTEGRAHPPPESRDRAP